MLIVIEKKRKPFCCQNIILVCPGAPGDPGVENDFSSNYPGPVGAPGDSGVRGHPGNPEIFFSNI